MPPMPTTCRVFVVPPATPAEPRPRAVEDDGAPIVVPGSDDAAKRQLRELLDGKNFRVRSLSWAPSRRPGQPAELIATVENK